MNNNKLNACVIGLGKMGLLHAGILNRLDGVRITAVAEREKIIANYVKESLPDVHVYEDSEEMFESEKLDVAFITTPVSSHYPIAESCIKHNIHFFIEKPLCKNLNEASKLCESLKNHPQIIHSVGFNRRFIDTFAKTKSLLEMKILGDISSVKSTMYVSNIFSKGTGWRSNKNISGGGVLLDLGSHVVDLLLWYFGPIESINLSELKSIYSKEVDDSAHATMKFSSNIEGEIDTSWSVPGYRLPELNIIVTGSNGKLRVNEDFIQIDLDHPDPLLPDSKMKIYKQDLNTGVPIDLGGPEYTKEDVHVVECVNEKKHTLVNAYEAARTQSVIEAIYDAARTNSTKRVEYFG
jgi:predicted dehydrogenase